MHSEPKFLSPRRREFSFGSVSSSIWSIEDQDLLCGFPTCGDRRQTAAASSFEPPPPPSTLPRLASHASRATRSPPVRTSDPEGFARRWPTSRSLLTNTWSTVIEHLFLLFRATPSSFRPFVNIVNIVMRGISFPARFEDRARWGFLGRSDRVGSEEARVFKSWRSNRVRSIIGRFCSCERNFCATGMTDSDCERCDGPRERWKVFRTAVFSEIFRDFNAR